MKKSLAIYKLYGNQIEYINEYDDYREDDVDWTRTSEVVVVEFPELPTEIVQEGLIAAVQAEIDQERAEHLTKAKRLDEKMAKLRALPAPQEPEVTLGPGYDGEEDVVIHDA